MLPRRARPRPLVRPPPAPAERDPLRLPLLFVGADVVLPGMVVPLQLNSERQAAVDAARSAATEDAVARVLLVPRVDGRYGTVGAVAEIVQVGRTPGGDPAGDRIDDPPPCPSQARRQSRS